MPIIIGGPAMSRTPVVHHRPRVRRAKVIRKWWSECVCGHARLYPTWRRAFIDALIHSEVLK